MANFKNEKTQLASITRSNNSSAIPTQMYGFNLEEKSSS